MLASAGIARDRDLTCVALIKDDVIHAGGKYRDAPVVRHDNLITSRLPSDLHVFCKEIIAYLREAPRTATKPLEVATPRVSAAYTHQAELSQGPRGTASADYTMVVKNGRQSPVMDRIAIHGTPTARWPAVWRTGRTADPEGDRGLP